MRRIVIALVALLFQGATATAVEVVGATKIKEHTIGKLTATKLSEGAAVLWDAEQSGLTAEECGLNLFWTGAPGTYRISLLAISVDAKQKVTVERVRITLEVEGVAPPKPPDPPKPPTPPTGKIDAMNARVKIRFGNAGCTATVIAGKRADGRYDVFSAAHCVGGVGSKGTGVMPDGTNLVLTVTVREAQSDIAWFVAEPIPSEPYQAILASKCPPPGTPIWNAGYGVREPGKKQEGVTTRACDSLGQLWYRIEMSGGDSGSGQFRTDNNECVATLFGTKGGGGVGGGCERAWQLRPSQKTVDYVLKKSADGWVLDDDGYWYRVEHRLISPDAPGWTPRPIPALPRENSPPPAPHRTQGRAPIAAPPSYPQISPAPVYYPVYRTAFPRTLGGGC